MADSRELQLLLTVNDRMSNSLRQIGSRTEGLTKQTSKLNTAVKGLVGAYIGIQGLRAAINGTIGAAVRWESAFAGVRKTVDATEEQFGKINAQLRQMALEIPVSAVELANIGEVAGQLGVDADNISKFTETVAKLGVATVLTSEEAASTLARIANIMQIPLDQVDRMGSVLVELGNNFATTEREINDFALRIAGAGKIAGLTTADVFGIGAAMSSVGVQAEAGGTAVQKVLIEMNRQVVSSGEKLNIFARTAGMSAQEFKDAWESDAGAAFTAFVEGLGASGDEAINTLSELGLQDQRLLRSFLSLANAGDVLGRAMNSANTEFEENNALTQEAEKRFATTESQMQLFKNQMNEIGIILGDAFLPAINKGLSVLGDFALGWADANENIRATFSSFSEFIDTLKYFPSALMEIGEKIGAALQEIPVLGVLLEGIGNFGANLINAFRGGEIVRMNPFASGAARAPGRASGGPVEAGRPYTVGEAGPELFVPRTSGSIIPNGGMGGVTVNVYGDVSGQELVRKVREAIAMDIKRRELV